MRYGNHLTNNFLLVGKVNSAERDNTAVHPIWKESHGVFSLSSNWPDNASEETKREKKNLLVEISNRLGDIVGPDGGTYINEANPYVTLPFVFFELQHALPFPKYMPNDSLDSL